jgi:hypothetical protein
MVIHKERKLLDNRLKMWIAFNQTVKEDNMGAQRKGLRGYRLIILALVGAALAIFGAIWIAVVFPSLDKIPANYERTLNFDGSFMVANPTTQSLDTIPITQTTEQKAIGTEGNILLIKETNTVTDSTTGNDLSSIYGGESILAVDRSTLAFVPSLGDIPREGQWAPPKGLGEGNTFLLWNPAANRALEAKYASSEQFRGLNVVVFNIDENNLLLGPDPRANNLNAYLSTHIALKIEPSSGTVVDENAVTTVSYDVPGMGIQPSVISNVQYAESTITDLMGTARSASWLLLWFKTLIPWIAIGFGTMLVISSAITVAVRDIRKARAKKSTHFPKPTSFPLDV